MKIISAQYKASALTPFHKNFFWKIKKSDNERVGGGDLILKNSLKYFRFTNQLFENWWRPTGLEQVPYECTRVSGLK